MSKVRPESTGNLPKVAPDEPEQPGSKGPAEESDRTTGPDLNKVLLVQPQFLMADADPEQLLTEMAIERWSPVLGYNLDRRLGPAN